ncbi:MAG TPA: GNAT family N-acetyltransferase [Candidatus Cybelea sp.]
MIRPVKDEPAFLAFHELLVEYEADLPLVLRHGSVPSVGELERSYRGRSAAFLADVAGRAVGCVAVSELDARTGVIVRLFVQPESRGAGAARALVLRALEFLEGNGYSRVVLDTDKEQLPAAYRLYGSLGFTECGPYTTVSYPSPTFMEREIG